VKSAGAAEKACAWVIVASNQRPEQVAHAASSSGRGRFVGKALERLLEDFLARHMSRLAGICRRARVRGRRCGANPVSRPGSAESTRSFLPFRRRSRCLRCSRPRFAAVAAICRVEFEKRGMRNTGHANRGVQSPGIGHY